MKLSQLFSGEVRTDGAASRSSQLTPSQMEQANRQIRSMVPGQTISGEIVSRNGNEVQIRLSEDVILNARVDRNLNIEVGKNMTFEVKNNGNSLTLSPLFTNVATGVNVLKALDMAGLPVNQTSIDMTEQLMAAGMSVSRNSLLQIFREVTGFPQAEISDIINLHRLQMPVNEANLNQMISYRNLDHQLTEGMNAVLDALPEVFDSLAAEGNTAGTVKLYQELLRLVQNENDMVTPDTAAPVSDTAAAESTANVMSDQTGSEIITDPVSDQPSAETMEGPVSDNQTEIHLITEQTVRNMTDTGSIQTVNDIAGSGSEPAVAGQSVKLVSEMFPLQEETDSATEYRAESAEFSGRYAPENGSMLSPENGNQSLSRILNPESRQENEPLRSETHSGLENEIRENSKPEMQNSAASREAMTDSIPAEQRTAVAKDALLLLDSMHNMPQEQTLSLRSGIVQFARGEMNVQQFFSILDSLAGEARFSSESMKLLEKMFSEPKFRNLLSSQLKDSWMLRPEEVALPNKVEEMYRRLDRQLKTLGNVLENTGQSESTAYRAVSSMSQNIDFLQQLNQMYTYVQLPLRLQQRDAQGELYVYTNKKKLTSQDGTVSALLHLDMEYLGPVDVYVALKSNRVSTRFYLQDDGIIDFMAGHMDVLTQRLEKRGYDCSFSMVRRDTDKERNETTNGGLEPVLRQNKGIMLSHYAFDVRT